jgi:hypothetical protein
MNSRRTPAIGPALPFANAIGLFQLELPAFSREQPILTVSPGNWAKSQHKHPHRNEDASVRCNGHRSGVLMSRPVGEIAKALQFTRFRYFR